MAPQTFGPTPARLGHRPAAPRSAVSTHSWVPMGAAGHSMIRDWRRWHRLTAEFVDAHLAETLPEP